MNKIKMEVYSSGTTLLPNQDDLRMASNVRFSTNYPGGLYGDASFYLPRNVVDPLALKGTQRVIFRNGREIVYEGWITSLESNLNESDQGVTVNCLGAWGYTAMRRHWRKRWADKRLTDDIWWYNTGASGAEKCSIDRQSRLRFTPKAEAWTNGEGASVWYTMPTGQTVKRVTYDYQLAEGAQAWEISLYRSTDSSSWTQMTGASGETYATGTTTVVTTSATGSIDVTLGTASRYVSFGYFARADQTPTSDGAFYGQITNLVVYSETGAINVTEILKDIRPTFTDINADESYISSNTLDLTPFIIDRWTTIADIMMQAADFGDASFNRWVVGLTSSERAATPDGKPLLYLNTYPALTDYDYAVRLDEENVIPPFSITRDFGEIYNYIIVEYTDELGKLQQIMPEDTGYESLQNAASVTAYGGRAYILNVGSSTAAAAYNSGQRFLAAYKDPQWKIEGPITVLGYIRAKSGKRISASEIAAGKRLKIENYLQDLSGTGLTFLISHTEYDDEAQTCSISIGPPSDLVYPRYIFEKPMPVDSTATTGGEGEGGHTPSEARLNWKRQYGLIPGTPEWEEAVKLGKRAWREKYRTRTKVKQG